MRKSLPRDRVSQFSLTVVDCVMYRHPLKWDVLTGLWHIKIVLVSVFCLPVLFCDQGRLIWRRDLHVCGNWLLCDVGDVIGKQSYPSTLSGAIRLDGNEYSAIWMILILRYRKLVNSTALCWAFWLWLVIRCLLWLVVIVPLVEWSASPRAGTGFYSRQRKTLKR